MIRALLSGAIDYAGLFPPAGLSMADAARAYDRYRRGPDAWALGRFVVPAARLEELAGCARRLPPQGDSWRLSALLGADPVADVEALQGFARYASGYAGEWRAIVDSIEAKADTIDAVEALAARLPGGVETFVEVPVGVTSVPLLHALAEKRLHAKFRTGGVTAVQFPSADDLAACLVACASLGLAFKATAGLHHPVRAEYRLTYAPDSPTGPMFGFLNLFAAAAAARGGADATAVAAILGQRDVGALPVDAATARSARDRFALSFGSCSFEEPLVDLRTLGLLPS